MKCPICEYKKKAKETVCPKCMFSTEVYITEVSEEQKAAYAERVRIARENWKKSEILKKKPLQQELPDSSHQHDTKAVPKKALTNINEALPEPAGEKEDSPPIPPLNRDSSETKRKYRKRINKIPPVVIGYAWFRNYDIPSKRFYLDINLKEWMKSENIKSIFPSEKHEAYIPVVRLTVKRDDFPTNSFEVYGKLKTNGVIIFIKGIQIKTKSANYKLKFCTTSIAFVYLKKFFNGVSLLFYFLNMLLTIIVKYIVIICFFIICMLAMII